MKTTRLIALFLISIEINLTIAGSSESKSSESGSSEHHHHNTQNIPVTIFNGEDAIPGQYPYSVYLYSRSRKISRTCGGSLISTRYVLTAAYCVDKMDTVDVLFGVHRTSPVLRITASKFIIHPDYDQHKYGHNIALIDLGRDIELTSDIGIVTLPKFTQISETFESREAVITSWRYATDSGSFPTQQMKFSRMNVISNERCSNVLMYNERVVGDTICAENRIYNGRYVCMGDYGDPLVLYEDGIAVQVGIANFFSERKCSSRDPLGFVRPHHYWNWISEVTGIQIRH